MPPLPPEIAEEENIYRFNTNLDSRQRGGRLEYLVDWEGYEPEERSWVSRDDMMSAPSTTPDLSAPPTRSSSPEF